MDINNIPEALSLPIRLKLISCLVSGKKTFIELKTMVEGSDGNVSVQLTKLENWGYIKSEKKIERKKTKSIYELTDYGLTQLIEYVELLGSIIDSKD
ncbi:MAG: transcriptional regulator [Sedimentibacter sp.]